MKTLKTILLVAFIAMVSNMCNAQGFGVRAGANFSTASEGNLGNIDDMTGAYVGVYKEMTLVKSLLFIQPELQLSKQGFSTSTTDFDLTYLTVPVLAKLYAVKILSFETGPQFGFKIKDDADGPLNPDFNDFDTAWAFGMSFNLPFGLSINGRYITSFSEVIENTDAKNQVIQAGAAFTF